MKGRTNLLVRSAIVFFAVLTCAAKAKADDNWPIPTVVLYDCNYLSATTNSSNPDSILSTASGFVYRQVLSDTSFKHIFLLNYGTADTLSIDSVYSGKVGSVPDTAGIAFGDFIVESAITGVPGSYKLTVSLLDARTRTQVASGSANFSSATVPNVEGATGNATAGILPIIAKIRNYQIQLRASNPGECIAPTATISPSMPYVPLHGSVPVTVNVTDCDGSPLSGVSVQLSGGNGQFAAQSAQTDGQGNATVNFNAGDSPAITVIAADISNLITVMKDTVNIGAQSLLTVGTPDTSSIWRLDFLWTIRKSSYSDAINSTGARNCIDSVESYTMKGTAIGYGFVNGSTFDFTSDSGALSGKSFAHYFGYRTGFGDCLDIQMNGTTINGKVATTFPLLAGLAFLYYDPGNNLSEFSTGSNFKGLKSSYMWSETPSPAEGGGCQYDPQHSESYAPVQSGKSISFASPDPHGQITPTQYGYLVTYNNTDIESDNTLSSEETSSSLSITVTSYIGKITPFNPVTAVKNLQDEIPNSYQLSQNYPNPFNPSTIINYQLASAGKVSIKIYDVLGREVKTLVDAHQNPGKYSVKFDASNVPSGIYFYRIDAQGKNGQRFISTKRLALIK